jgi:hypothetical protein
MSVKNWISDAVLQAQVDRSGAEISRTSDLDSETKVVTHPYPSQTPNNENKRRETKRAKKKKREKKKSNLFTYTPED